MMTPLRRCRCPAAALAAALLPAVLLAGCCGPEPLPPETLYPAAFLEEREIQEALLREGDREAARIQAAERLDADRSPLNLILAARVETDTETALALLDEAMEKDSLSVWGRYGIAFMVFKRRIVDRYEESIEHLEWILDRGFGQASPVDICPRRLLIEILNSVHRYEEALDHWTIYIASHPNDLKARYDMAWLLSRRLDRPDEALEQVRRIVSDDPGRVDARLLEGCVLRRLGEFVEAARVFKRIEDRHPDALLNLAQLYDTEIVNPAVALSYYKRFQEYEGENEDQRSAVDRYFRVPPRIDELEKKLEELNK